MKTIEIVIGAIFVVMIFGGMLFVPSFAMGEDNTMEKWMQDHTVKVNATTTCKYEQGYLLIKEVYTGEELKERFGIEHFTKELKIPVEGVVVQMQEGEEETFVTEKVTVLTSADDPPHWWDNYEYPQWTWSESRGIYEKEEPINLAWKYTTKGVVISEILDEEWWDSGFWHQYYVYDPIDGWIDDDNVADDPIGLFGRYHARLWQMSDGNVVANAHHDTSVPHEAEKLEEAEELVASYFNEPDDTEWQVYEDSYYLDNAVMTLDNNGWCTQIDPNPMMGPTIVSYTISNRMITPPQTTEIDVAFSERVSYRIAIENATGTVYDWTGKAKNPNAKVWNGAYESDGTVVPAGDYTVNVTGTNTTTGSYVTNNTGIITVASGGDVVVTIKADTTEVSEHTIVQLTVTGVAGMTINVKADPSSANAYFPAGLDDNPMDKTTNNFNDTIDDDGMRTYAIEFNDTGSYTIKVTDLDTDTYDSVDITVIEKEVIFDVPSTVVIGDKFDIKGTANIGDTVTVAVEDEVVQKLYQIVIDEYDEFCEEIDTSSADAPAAFKNPGSVKLKAYIDYDQGTGTVPSNAKDDGSVVILMTSLIHIISGNYSTIWNESLVANYTYAMIVPDLDGDGNPDVLVLTGLYDPATDIETRSIIAKKGIDGMQLWVETVTATGENNCTILPLPSGDLDGDGLNDVIISENKYDAGAETAKVIAKKGINGTQLWEETVTASGEKSCDIFAVPVGDLDGDKLTDVIVTESKYDETTNTAVARVIAKQGSNGTHLWEESVNATGKENCGMDALPAGDLDGDELADVIVIESKYDGVTETARVIAKQGSNGTHLWEESVNATGKENCGMDALPAGDLDGDSLNDTLVIESKYNETTNTTVARVIAKQGSNGTHLWEESVSATGKDNCDIDVEWAGNLDGDGLNDVIVSESKYDGITETARVIAKKGSNGTHLWEESVNATSKDNCNLFAVYAGDLDGDGLDDVIVSEFKRNETTFMPIERIIAMKGNTGTYMWEESVTGMAPFIYVLPVGDLDGDGLNDVIVSEIKYNETTFMPMASVIAKKGKTGAHMWEESVTGAVIYASPAGDLDGDGLNDVIVSENKYNQSTDTTTARVIAKRGKNGKPLLEAQSNELIWDAMGVYDCDLNGDGTDDLLLGIPTEIYALTCIHGAVNKTPVADFSYSPGNPVVNQTITFNASASYDPDGFITEYEWQFDDGTNTTGEEVTHSYSSAGNYTVTLTVTDNATATNTTSKVIEVQSSSGITFDTGEPANPYPSISGTHKGTITPVADLVLSRMYTYPCPGTGGHSEYVKIEGHGLNVNATWDGYDDDDWHNITFDEPFVTLEGNKTYNFTIRTGSYPQIIHEPGKEATGGTINCTEFVDVNGKKYYDWIPAIRID